MSVVTLLSALKTITGGVAPSIVGARMATVIRHPLDEATMAFVVGMLHGGGEQQEMGLAMIDSLGVNSMPVYILCDFFKRKINEVSGSNTFV